MQDEQQPRVPLEERLAEYAAGGTDPVPPQLLRKYIAYARAHVHPALSEDAKQVRLCYHA